MANIILRKRNVAISEENLERAQDRLSTARKLLAKGAFSESELRNLIATFVIDKNGLGMKENKDLQREFLAYYEQRVAEKRRSAILCHQERMADLVRLGRMERSGDLEEALSDR